MARPSRLLADVRSAARSLGVAAAWARSRKPLRVEEDFIYEMYLLFRVVEDLSARYRILYYPGNGCGSYALELRSTILTKIDMESTYPCKRLSHLKMLLINLMF
jgi:hypothetical protein